MPSVAANGITIHYDVKGSGEPLVLIPFHDGRPLYAEIEAPTLITFGREDRLASMRFAPALHAGIRTLELAVFGGCAHAPISEDPAMFNTRTLGFLLRQR